MFGRKKTKNGPGVSGQSVVTAEKPVNDADDLRAQGPYDVSEIASKDEYLDLGAILLKPQPGVGIRLEVNEKTKRPVAVNLDVAGSTAQIQVFAAPKSTGIWDEVRKDMRLSLESSKGTFESVEGTFGTELRARFPAQASDGTTGYRAVRYVGIDGPRWFLRTIISGAAAIDPDALKAFDELIQGIVVVRGKDPMPPRDLLPLVIPENAQPARKNTQQREKPTERSQTSRGRRAKRDLAPPERGPETAEVR